MHDHFFSDALTGIQTIVFSLLAKVWRDNTEAEQFAGKLLQKIAPATANTHVPTTVLVLETTRDLLSADRRCGLPATVEQTHSRLRQIRRRQPQLRLL